MRSDVLLVSEPGAAVSGVELPAAGGGRTECFFGSQRIARVEKKVRPDEESLSLKFFRRWLSWLSLPPRSRRRLHSSAIVDVE